MGWFQSLTSGIRRMFGGGAPQTGGAPATGAATQPAVARAPQTAPVVRGAPAPMGPAAGVARAVAPTQPDRGLADMGVRPAPGTRTETREQYQQRMSRERAIATINRINPDQPLENPIPGMATMGHMHAHHGFQTTEAQQADRVVTGRKPDQAPTDAPAGAPRGRASRFDTPQQEVEALRRSERAFNSDLATGGVQSFPDPVTGAPTFVNPATGQPAAHTNTVRTNNPAGFGTSQVVERQPPPSTAIQPDASGQRVAVPSPTALPQAPVTRQFVPSTGEWRIVTGFPQADPLPTGQPNLR